MENLRESKFALTIAAIFGVLYADRFNLLHYQRFIVLYSLTPFLLCYSFWISIESFKMTGILELGTDGMRLIVFSTAMAVVLAKLGDRGPAGRLLHLLVYCM